MNRVLDIAVIQIGFASALASAWAGMMLLGIPAPWTANADPAGVDDPPHICQPDNVEGEPPGCYDDGGVLVAGWPCEPWRPDARQQPPERPYGGKP
jgi:hypothetical protein